MAFSTADTAHRLRLLTRFGWRFLGSLFDALNVRAIVIASLRVFVYRHPYGKAVAGTDLVFFLCTFFADNFRLTAQGLDEWPRRNDVATHPNGGLDVLMLSHAPETSEPQPQPA